MSEVHPLPPELWNLSAVIVVCCLLGWAVRLVRLLLMYLEARYSVQHDAVLHLEKLGPSLHVLRNASMWHFHQLLRTQLQGASETMKRVQVPFDFIASSLQLVEASDAQPHTSLRVEIKCRAKCSVQVFWDVKVAALELEGARRNANESSPQPVKQLRRWVDGSLSTRAMQSAIHAVRSIPDKFYDAGFLNTPHRLLEDDVDNQVRGAAVASQQHPFSCAGLFGGENAFRSRSTMTRCSDHTDEYVAALPSELFPDRPVEEIQSSIVATDCEDTPPAPTPVVDEPRYACVMVIGCYDLVESVSPRQTSSSTASDVEDEILCQCVAIDFLPTPAQPRGAPVVARKLHFTASSVYSSQELFSSESECVICLERAVCAVLLPCRHLCVCRPCLEKIDQCPICRAKFFTYVCCEQDAAPSEVAVDVM